MARVDVLLPTYNRGEMLLESVRSILGQTIQDFRLVIYDDGSTDRSIERLPKDPRIVLLRGEENQGIAFARNQLLQHIESPFCCWQDSDDVSDPTRLAKMLRLMKSTGADVGLSYLYFFNGSVQRKHWHLYKVDTTRYAVPGKEEGPQDFGIYNNMTFATCFFKKELKVFPFDLTKRISEDAQWFRTLIQAGKTFVTLPEPLYFARRHAGRSVNLFQENPRF